MKTLAKIGKETVMVEFDVFTDIRVEDLTNIMYKFSVIILYIAVTGFEG